MKINYMKKILFLSGLWLSISILGQNPTGSPVAIHGLLKTKGSHIVGAADTAISLAGNSLFWSQWSATFYNADVVHWLKTDWNSKIIRAAMGVDETGGYITNPDREKQKVITIVDACIAEGLYVIIDWHSHHAENYKTESIAFFKEMATKYGQYPNVIYEIYNEPLDTATWATKIKPYATDVVKEIRAIDPDNLILVGTRTWSQEVLEAGNDPINDNNLAYVLHFYVGMHGQYLRDKAQLALDKGIPLFVSEWGLWGSSSDLDNWMNFMKKNQLSWCNWSIFTKDEPPSSLKASANPKGNWTSTDLTTIGKKVRNFMLDWPHWTPLPPEPCTLKTEPYKVPQLPGSIEAEDYDKGCDGQSYHDIDDSNLGGKYRTDGVDIEVCTDANKGYNVGYLEKDEWMNYTIKVVQTGTFDLKARVASLSGGGKFHIELDSIDVTGSIIVPKTNGWQTWSDLSLGKIDLQQLDTHVVRIVVEQAGFNLNYISFVDPNAVAVDDEMVEHTRLIGYPNPFSSTIMIQQEGIFDYSLNNSQGHTVLEGRSEDQILLGNGLPHGIYILKIKHELGQQYLKIVKQ